MADRSGLQAQIASVIEILANSAVVEICRLVEDGYTALCSQMEQEREQCQEENDVLRQKLRETDEKLRSCDRKLRRRRRHEKMFTVRLNLEQQGKQMFSGTASEKGLIGGTMCSTTSFRKWIFFLLANKTLRFRNIKPYTHSDNITDSAGSIFRSQKNQVTRLFLNVFIHGNGLLYNY